jgi:DNA polymerase-4
MSHPEEDGIHQRKILHLDLDAFYCAVEEQRDPSLIGVPFAVGGKPDERGVVSSCSYAARAKGVHSGMPMARALRLCPELKIVRSHHSAYSQASKEVMERLKPFTPLIEQLSIDEAFLDVSKLLDQPLTIATQIQRKIRSELSLPCSLGGATNKLVAKIANDYGKTRTIALRETPSINEGNHPNGAIGPPNAITIVEPGEEAEFLAPLPVRALWGVGPKTAQKLTDLDITTIGELAEYSERELGRLFGKNGYDLARRAKGIDKRPITTHHEPKSFSQEITFARDESKEDTLRDVLHKMSEKISKRLERAGYICTTVKLKLRWPNFDTITRQETLPAGTDSNVTIYNSALKLLMKEWSAGQAVRLIGVGVSGLRHPIRQLSFWDEAMLATHEAKGSNLYRDKQLQQALDELRQRYGDEILLQASKLIKDKDK